MSNWKTLILTLAAALVVAATPARATIMYGVTGAGGSASSLYTIDTATGAASLVGSTGFTHMTGLDFDPTTGTLYGVADSGFGPDATLVTINTSTGAGTVVGTMTGAESIPDISFDSTGQLYAWTETGDRLLTVDKNTGAIVDLGPNNFGTARTGMAFGAADMLFVKTSNDYHTVDASNGDSLGSVSLSGPSPGLVNGLEYDVSTGTMYALGGEGFGGGRSSFLNTIDAGAGTYTQIGEITIGGSSLLNISALAIAVDVPAPATLALALLGVAGVAARRQKRRARS